MAEDTTSETPAPVVEGAADDEKKALQEQAASYGIAYDGRWSTQTLKDKIAEAKAASPAREKAEADVKTYQGPDDGKKVPPNDEQYPAGLDTRPEEVRAEEAKQALLQPDMRDGLATKVEVDDKGSKPPEDAGEVFSRRSHFPVRMLAGYWPEDGSPKVPKGARSDLPIGEAKRVIAAGIGERADELPQG